MSVAESDKAKVASEDAEVANDAIQLVTVATFNGLCRLIAALAERGRLSPMSLDDIHEAMTAPLDDPDWRDDEFIASTRDTLNTVLAQAVSDASSFGSSEGGTYLIPDWP